MRRGISTPQTSAIAARIEGVLTLPNSSSSLSTRELEAAQSAAHPFGEAITPPGSIPMRVFFGAARRMLALLRSASLPLPSHVAFSLTYADGSVERIEMDTETGATSSNTKAAPSAASQRVSGGRLPRPD